MILTPRLTLRRRVAVTAIGLVALFALHIAANLAEDPRAHAFPIAVALFLDAAPFLLWAAIAYPFVREIATRRTAQPPEPED